MPCSITGKLQMCTCRKLSAIYIPAAASLVVLSWIGLEASFLTQHSTWVQQNSMLGRAAVLIGCGFMRTGYPISPGLQTTTRWPEMAIVDCTCHLTIDMSMVIQCTLDAFQSHAWQSTYALFSSPVRCLACL